MIVPTNIPITVYRGFAFDVGMNFTNSDGSAYDFATWVVTASLESAESSNEVAFSVDVVGGSVTLSLTDTETEALSDVANTSYLVQMVSTDGTIGPYPIVNGNVNVLDLT